MEINMKRLQARRAVVCAALLALVAATSFPTPSRAETGSVRVVFTKAGFIVGVGGGHGVLAFRGHHYPFTVSGMSFGATIGASTTQLVGRALNMRSPGDIAGTYSAIGAGGALAAGAGGVTLQNQKGVVLELSGAKVGVEVSAAVGGVTITMQ
jgi:lipid-binding SYLF domain-containing protein